MTRKIERNPEAAFGLFDHTMPSKINRLLREHGLKLKVRGSVNWGDQVEVTIEPMVQGNKGSVTLSEALRELDESHIRHRENVALD